MLVTLCAGAAWQSFDNRQAARHRLCIGTIAQQLVVADEDLRDERSAVDTVRYGVAGPAASSDMAPIAQLRGRSRTALAALNAALKTEEGVLSAPERQRLARLQSRYEAASEAMAVVLRRPRADRSPA